MNFDNFKYRKEKVTERYVEEKLYYENLRNTFFEELKNSDKHNDFFKGFNPDSVKDFMFEYAKQKANMAQFYETLINETYQKKELRYRDNTEKVFEMILQKKLWNMQLKWRAGQINIKEIRTSWDFGFWESHVSSCPFLPMVTESEVEVMKQFLLDSNFDDQSAGMFFDWQDYDEIMRIDEDGDRSSMPDWYEFYDGRLGTGILLSLPDIRGKKEEYYLDLARSYYAKTRNTTQPATPPLQPEYTQFYSYLHSGFEEMYKYALKYEDDPHFVELFRIKYEINKPKEYYSQYDDDNIDDAIRLLKESDSPVKMPGGLDWREAVVKCSQQYLNRIVAKEIDFVYEEYKMFSEIGLSRNDDDDVMTHFENYEIAKIVSPGILKGRELDGDPPDYNY